MRSLKGERMMKTNGMRRCVVAVLSALVLLTSGAVAASAETTPGYKKGEVVLVSEKTVVAPRVIAVRNGTVATVDALDWEDGGVHGQAVHLNGAGDYIEYTNSNLCSGEISVAGWVNWLGSVSDDPSKELNQQFFTVFRDANNYFTLNLHGYRDNVRQTEDGTVYRMDGVCLEYRIDGNAGKLVESFNETTGGVDYAIRQNEWTHLTITISKKAIKLYVNGVHWFEEPLEGACTILAGNGVRIGGTVGDTPYTLSALVDDVAIFKGVLQAEDIDYLAKGATLDFKAPTAPSAPTGAQEGVADTSEAETSGDNFKDTDNSGELSVTIPGFTWYVLGGLLVLMVGLTIALNKHEEKRNKEDAQ